ncbi:MAG: GNAT family N-acetyltransferase [Flavobacteriales bacterium]|nr:GNAT family N-acetyltransferase [Flavobacteriales bacterium]
MPQREWNEFASDDVFLGTDYLKTMEHSKGVQRVFYIAFFAGKRWVGIAVVQQVGFHSKRVDDNLQSKNAVVRYLTRKLTPANSSAGSVLLCGNAYATGEHAFRFSREIPEQKAMEGVCAAISELAAGMKNEVSAIVVKDFYGSAGMFTSSLNKGGFASFSVDHNMMMPVLPHWKTFEDYLADLNTKFRTKAHAALKRSEVLEVKDFSTEELRRYRDRLNDLFVQVIAKADFKMGDLSFDDLLNLHAQMGDKMKLRVYMIDGEPVGFLAAFLYNKVLDAHVVGIDYAKNRNYAIYSRILYDYIAMAIESGMEQIWFGRTAGEIKTSVGAVPVDMCCCIRHTRKTSNFLLRILFNYVKPTDFPKRRPYHKEVGEQVARWAEERAQAQNGSIFTQVAGQRSSTTKPLESSL